MEHGNEIKVWDPLVRIFHWSLVAAFFIAFVSGEEWESLHVAAGYVVGGLVVFRLLWGFIGTPHARFTDFVRSPATVIAYLKDMAARRAKRYLGHNPAGGWMIVALLVSLALTTLTGLAANGTLKVATTLIPLAMADEGDAGGEEEGPFGEVHEFFAYFTLLLVVAHVAGVIVSSIMHRENLVRAMITGNKQRDL